MFRVILLGFLVFSVSLTVVPTPVYAISLDDDEEDAEDVADLLKQAKKAAKSESFSKADALLKKAKMYGVNTDKVKEASKYIATKKRERDARIERERLARLKREKEERARRARLAQQEGNYGLPKSQCYRTSSNYALYRYCTTGSCDGFASNYALYQLCQYNNPNGFHSSNRNTNINLYLQNGGMLSYDYFSDQAAYQSGRFNGSFRDRKNFILYLLSGMILMKY
ncbi:hypothetical protein MNB_SV-4-158 [hydrothermal vent metagenome]|uniref:Uncharacterized protein n=1 Tax=hydrothermal vent metagenome TaxID=652676 RepID=A0A1W1EB68_9ZZZZ